MPTTRVDNSMNSVEINAIDTQTQRSVVVTVSRNRWSPVSNTDLVPRSACVRKPFGVPSLDRQVSTDAYPTPLVIRSQALEFWMSMGQSVLVTVGVQGEHGARVVSLFGGPSVARRTHSMAPSSHNVGLFLFPSSHPHQEIRCITCTLCSLPPSSARSYNVLRELRAPPNPRRFATMGGRVALLVGLLCILATVEDAGSAGLVYDHYKTSCPEAETIIHDTVFKLYEKKGNIATSLIRYVFHDCFNGCDGSFLLESTEDGPAEKESPNQVGMRNEKYVDVIKAAVEDACPGVVSCADVLALGGAAGAEALGGPAMKLKTGRKDSRVSTKAAADAGIPTPQSDVTTVLNYFGKMGITTEQAVALLGAHTIGRAHCESFEERIYPTVDPKMDPAFASMLKYRCPQQKTAGARGVHFTYFRNDEQSPMAFDNHYYVNLVAKQGLLHVDSEIAWDARTKPHVEAYAADNALWHKNFAAAFTILSEQNPLTGGQGEVRKQCSYTL